MILATEKQLRTVLGHRIREARLAAGLTQTELGDLIGVHQVSVSCIEHGRVPLRVNLDRIVEAIRVSLVELLEAPGEEELARIAARRPDGRGRPRGVGQSPEKKVGL